MQCVGGFTVPSFPITGQEISRSACEGLTKAVHFFATLHQDWQATKKNWHERVITQLDSFEHFLDEKIPNFSFQDKIDRLGQSIKKEFAPLAEFNSWLDSNGHGSWFQQLATFLVKLPIRAARNIVETLYEVVKTAMYAAVHPLKALNHLVKYIVDLIYELTKPETWTMIGAGLVGGGLGQVAVAGNPLSLIGVGIGAGMILGGLSIGALQAALEAEDGYRGQAALQNFCTQVEAMPEHALGGFCMGLLVGAISKCLPGKAEAVRPFRRESITIHEPFPDGMFRI